jgi:membrane associated rhomboid family serine protease
MHGDISHIFFNMFGLYMFGTPLEQMWGKAEIYFFISVNRFWCCRIHCNYCITIK